MLACTEAHKHRDAGRQPVAEAVLVTDSLADADRHAEPAAAPDLQAGAAPIALAAAAPELYATADADTDCNAKRCFVDVGTPLVRT